MDAGIRRRS